MVIPFGKIINYVLENIKKTITTSTTIYTRF